MSNHCCEDITLHRLRVAREERKSQLSLDQCLVDLKKQGMQHNICNKLHPGKNICYLTHQTQSPAKKDVNIFYKGQIAKEMRQ